MIYFLLASSPQISAFKRVCKDRQLSAIFLDLQKRQSLDQLYQAKSSIDTIVASCSHPRMALQAWLDIINAWGGRVPVIALYSEEHLALTQQHQFSSSLLWQPENQLEAIFNALEKLPSLGLTKGARAEDAAIGVLPPAYAIQLLHRHGYLSAICIDTSEFRSIAIAYGRQTYHRLRSFFQNLLFSLWGKSGSFRQQDKLFHSTQNNNLFYILLDPPRARQGAPNPGQLEALTERIMATIQQALWREFAHGSKGSIVPLDLNAMPHFYLGYDTIVHNPCIDPYEAVDMLLATSRQTALIQQQRIAARQKEFMQLLIQSDSYLTTHFQGIFYAKNLSAPRLNRALQEKSLAQLAPCLYGFEALTRINQEKVEVLFQQRGQFYFDPRFLGPEVLFTMARMVKLSLELDQACLRMAVRNFGELPGRLTANILPRNCYYIDQLLSTMEQAKPITFEIAESEAINNHELLLQAKAAIASRHHDIAIDDFGKGHAGFNRIIAIEPGMIKLDRLLIKGIAADEVRKSYVQGIINAAAINKILVLAEGVETLSEMLALQELGVDLFQGNLFHLPSPREEISAQLSGAKLRPLPRRRTSPHSGRGGKSRKTTPGKSRK